MDVVYGGLIALFGLLAWGLALGLQRLLAVREPRP